MRSALALALFALVACHRNDGAACDEPYLLDCPAAVEEMRGCCDDGVCWFETADIVVLCDGLDCDEAGATMVLLVCGAPPG